VEKVLERPRVTEEIVGKEVQRREQRKSRIPSYDLKENGNKKKTGSSPPLDDGCMGGKCITKNHLREHYTKNRVEWGVQTTTPD